MDQEPVCEEGICYMPLPPAESNYNPNSSNNNENESIVETVEETVSETISEPEKEPVDEPEKNPTEETTEVVEEPVPVEDNRNDDEDEEDGYIDSNLAESFNFASSDIILLQNYYEDKPTDYVEFVLDYDYEQSTFDFQQVPSARVKQSCHLCDSAWAYYSGTRCEDGEYGINVNVCLSCLEKSNNYFFLLGNYYDRQKTYIICGKFEKNCARQSCPRRIPDKENLSYCCLECRDAKPTSSDV